ncbi:MAG TPA: type II secretion system F family protein [Candidatus Paceibacterota bacterium]
MKFRVTVKKADGAEEERVMDAPSRFAVYEQVEKEGATVAALEEGGGFTMPAWLNISFGTGISVDNIILMIKNLGAMLHAGLTLSRALTVVERQTRNKRLKAVLASVGASVKKGAGFHEALAEHPKLFSKLFIAMAHAGEESGTLSEALGLVGMQMERARNLTKKVRGAMIYPIIIIVAMAIIFVLMLMYVVPTLTNTFSQLGVQLPLATRIIVAISDFLIAHTLLLLLGVAAFVGAVWAFARSAFGGRLLFKLVLVLPVIGELVRETYAARTARTLASLLSSGVDMLGAIAITREVVSTETFASVLEEAQERVRKGEQLSAAFADHSDRYPLMFSDMIEVGEETGQVADMLKQVAEYYEGDVEQRTKDLSTIIEPILMLLIGAGVGVFAIAIISPIYSLSSAI